ncbi:MAG: hypothetical protein DWP97_05720 [Calditrichaeota bacterium]|nr:MAG: hypothetical protein DWP97_05720 [Calditrichota bacterium]
MSEFEDDNTQMHVPLTKGTMIAHYRIEKKIGAGGMGEVYLADDTKLNRKVALKFMPNHLAANEELRLRFTREAQAAAKLEHPNIVTIFEVSEHEQRPFIAMQYISGNTFHHYCYEEKLSLDKIVDLMIQVADGLAKAHKSGITHRDIKSVNIIVNDEFRAKILDFGLATIQGTEELTKAGSTLGTFAYMSPEQAEGKEVDHRSDIFSFGVVMYELISGKAPFKDSNDAATLQNVLHKKPDSVQTYNSEIPYALQEIVEKCLHKQKTERFQSAQELSKALRAVAMQTKNKKTITDESPSIAVLPFANMSTDPENEFFADGLTEELLNVLAKIPELKVTGRTSSFAFKGKQEDLRGIGSKLGVSTILEGSVRKSGNRVRITAQLVKTTDGFHLWSDTYDRVIEDIFAVQDEIAAAVAEEMHVTLLGKSKIIEPTSPESYELTLKAQQLSYSWTVSTMNEAISLYEQAIKIDSENAKAWAGLGRVYFVQCAYGFDDHETTYRNAKKAVMKALEFDNQLADAYEVLGWIRLSLEYHFDEANVAMKKALELAPNDCRIVSSVGAFKGMLGESAEAEKLLAKAEELDPLNPEVYMSIGRFYTIVNKFDESLEAFHKALKLSQGMAGIYTWISGILYIQGKYEESLKYAKLEESEGHRLQALAISYFGLGNKKESDAAVETMLNMPNADAWAFQLAMIYGERNEVDKSFKWLERAYRDRDAGLPQLKVAFYFKNLHSDPRWPVLLKKIGFTE